MRRLNDMTIKDSFPLIRIDDALDALGGSKYFATLDLQSGFWQIMLEEDSMPYTAFITADNLYEFERLPFGLCNSPATFCRAMMKCLKGLVWTECLLYIDDIVIYAPSFDVYLERISHVLTRLRQANLKVKPKKCVFGMPKIKFLGHIVSDSGVATDPVKCMAVRNFPVPKCLKSLRSFLGMTNYYSKFVKNYRDIASPLYSLTRKDVPFVWSEKCQNSFESLKEALQNAPTLGYPDFNETFILETDASQIAISFILSQYQKGDHVVLQYGGKTLKESEKRYSTTEREALAIFIGITTYKCYLEDKPFIIRTDHKPLVDVFKKRYGSERMLKWILHLSKYQFQIEYKRGRILHGPDAFSRREYSYEDSKNYTQVSEEDIDDEIFPPDGFFNGNQQQCGSGDLKCNKDLQVASINIVKRKSNDIKQFKREKEKDRLKFLGERLKYSYTSTSHRFPIQLPKPISPKQLRTWQLKDKYMKLLIDYLEEDKLPSDSKMTKIILNDAQDYFIDEGILYRIYVPPNTNKDDPRIRIQLCAPNELRFDILQEHHGDLSGAHYDCARVYATLRLNFFWKGMFRDCKKWVTSCEDCQRRKNPPRGYKAPLQPLPIAYINENGHLILLHLYREPNVEMNILYVLPNMPPDMSKRLPSLFPQRQLLHEY